MCVLGLLLAACGAQPGGTAPTPAATVTPNADSVATFPFTDEGATQQSGYTGTAPRVEVSQGGGRWRITAYLGQKNTGGYLIEIQRVTVQGGLARVHAFAQAPPAGAVVTQVITSPAHTVSIASTAFTPNEVVLIDQSGQELARTRP